MRCKMTKRWGTTTNKMRLNRQQNDTKWLKRSFDISVKYKTRVWSLPGSTLSFRLIMFHGARIDEWQRGTALCPGPWSVGGASLRRLVNVRGHRWLWWEGLSGVIRGRFSIVCSIVTDCCFKAVKPISGKRETGAFSVKNKQTNSNNKMYQQQKQNRISHTGGKCNFHFLTK